MTDLIKRLEEAEEGSADLAREVERALGVIPVGIREDGTWGRKQRPWTTSLDAALALAERVLPEMNCNGFDKTPDGTEAYVSRNNVESGHWAYTGFHRTPALALCIAILKATDTGRE